MKTTVNQRFKLIIAEIKYLYDVTQADIAFNIGVKTTYLSDMINGRVPVTDSVVQKIYENYSDLKTKYEDSTYLNNNNNSSLINISKEINVLSPISDVSVPYYDVDFAGGWNSEELFTTVRPSNIITSQEFSRSEFACNLVGHSISRRIPNRSVVGLKEIKDWQTYFPTNELYAIVMKNNLRTIKIVKRSKENKNNILLIPDPLPEHNKIEYDIEEVPMSFVKNFFQVVAWGFFERLVM